MKKSISVILSLLMVLSLFTVIPAAVSAEDVLNNGTYQYVIVDDHAEIVKYLKDDENVTIPSSLDGKSVTKLREDSFYDRSGKALKSVNIPDTVTAIDNYAFYKCSNLVTVRMSESLEYLGYSAFRDCSSLTAIKIPNTFPTILLLLRARLLRVVPRWRVLTSTIQ